MSEWKYLSILEIAAIVSGATPATNVKEYWDGEIMWITPNDLSNIKSRFINASERRISAQGLKSASISITPARSVVMSSRAPIGYFALSTRDFTTNQGCKSFMFNENQDSEFHYYNFLYHTELFKRYGSGSTFKEISKSNIEKLSFLIPIDKREQQNIATILSTVDEVIEKTEDAIAKYKSIKAGMMHDLFTRGIDVKTGKLRPSYQEAPALYKETELGWIPKDWEVLIFDDVIKEYFDFRGKTPLKLGMNWGGGSIKAISANNIEPGFINFNKEHYLASEDLYRVWMNRGDCSLGDVVMTSEAPLGVIAQIPDNQKYLLSQRVFLFKTNPSLITNDYLYYLVNTDRFQNDLIRQSSGSTVTGIQQARLAKIRILMATSIDEQRHISKKLKLIDRTLTDNDNMLRKYKYLKQGLMADLLTGKVKVKKQFIMKGI